MPPDPTVGAPVLDPTDRGMPGAGVIGFAHFLGLVAATGFSGPLEFEIFSQRNWWLREPDQIAAACAARHAALSGP